jgi:serine/threonine protein kinase
VVKFIGVCTKQGHFCIVSEFCTKGSLERLVRGNNRASIPLRTIVQMARDAAAGILHLHCESVIHRVRHAHAHAHAQC